MTATLEKYQRCNLNPMANSIGTETQVSILFWNKFEVTVPIEFQRATFKFYNDLYHDFSFYAFNQNWCQEVSLLNAKYESLQRTQRLGYTVIKTFKLINPLFMIV